MENVFKFDWDLIFYVVNQNPEFWTSMRKINPQVGSDVNIMYILIVVLDENLYVVFDAQIQKVMLEIKFSLKHK